ncbi:transcription initiation factor TFIID subunit 1 isoform X2 [Drosophila tropicalis]
MTSPIVVTTVEIRDLHNILNPDDLPKISLPHTPLGEATDMMLNSSAGTTASIETTSSPSTNRKIDGGSAGTGASSTIGTNVSSSPNRNKYKNHNNNQEDINSIKSISSFDGQRISSDFGWIDDAVQERNCNDMMHKNKRKKSKKARDSKLQLDQIDAKVVEYPLDAKLKEDQSHDNDSDEKVVKCLYYSLMCCDCTIS